MSRFDRDSPSERTALGFVDAGNPEEASHLETALELYQVLNQHYPNHPWQVKFEGGALTVRHLVIDAAVTAALHRECFGFKVPKHLTTRKDIVKAAIEAGGQTLELFGYRRGAWDGSEPTITRDLFAIAKKLGVPNTARLEAEYFA
jgi:hypothetical protein